MTILASLYQKAEQLGVRVEFLDPDWQLTDCKSGKAFALGDLTVAQSEAVRDIQHETFWPEELV